MFFLIAFSSAAGHLWSLPRWGQLLARPHHCRSWAWAGVRGARRCLMTPTSAFGGGKRGVAPFISLFQGSRCHPSTSLVPQHLCEVFLFWRQSNWPFCHAEQRVWVCRFCSALKVQVPCGTAALGYYSSFYFKNTFSKKCRWLGFLFFVGFKFTFANSISLSFCKVRHFFPLPA